MGCNNCGGGNRHNQESVPVVKTPREAIYTNEGVKYAAVSENKEPKLRRVLGPENSDQSMGESITPEEAFNAARQMSYEEIISRTKEQQEMMDRTSDEAINSMTDAMKRYHAISLLGIYNLDITSMAGISPTQALIGLHKVLKRPDFQCVRDLHPTLKEKVDEKVKELMQDRIIIE